MGNGAYDLFAGPTPRTDATHAVLPWRRGAASPLLRVGQATLRETLRGGSHEAWFSGSASPDSRGDSSLGPGGLTRPVL